MKPPKDPKKNGRPKRKPKKKPARKPAPKKKEDKPKSDERLLLERWEGDDFDTLDYQLLTDEDDPLPS